MDQWIMLADELTRRLLFSSLQAALLFVLLGLLMRCLPNLAAATRTWLWWLLGLQLLLGLLQPLQWSIPLPAWSARDTVTPVQSWVQYSQQVDGPGLLHTEVITHPRDVATGMTPTPPMHWSLLLAMLWLLGVMLQLAWHVRAWQESQRLWRRATPLDDPAQLAELARLARQLGLRRCPRLRQSDAIGSPQVTGLWCPTVLLPAQASLSPAELSLALCHELVHLRRGDLPRLDPGTGPAGVLLPPAGPSRGAGIRRAARGRLRRAGAGAARPRHPGLWPPAAAAGRAAPARPWPCPCLLDL